MKKILKDRLEGQAFAEKDEAIFVESLEREVQKVCDLRLFL